MQPKSYSIEEAYQLIKEKYPQYNDDTIIIPKYGKRLSITFKELIITILNKSSIQKTAEYFNIPDRKTLNKYLLLIFPELFKNSLHWKVKFLLQVNLKQCSNCQNIYSLNNFNFDSYNATLYYNKCISCTKKACKKYYEKNKGKCNANVKKYQVTKLQRIPKWVTKEELIQIEQFYINRPKGYHVDHIIPLQGKNVSGFHCLSNLQYLLASENLSKTNKYIPKIEYY